MSMTSNAPKNSGWWERAQGVVNPASQGGYDPVSFLKSGNKNSWWDKSLNFLDPLSSLGGDNGMGEALAGINAGYDQSMKEIEAKIATAEAQGRTDIADSLRKSYGLNEPYMKAGNTAMGEWMNSLGIGDQGAKGTQGLMDKFQQSPGYQYSLQQANLASQRKAAASGQGMSGAEQRELGAQSQGLANQDWTNWLNNYQGNLSAIAGRGQQSSMQQAGFETQGGNWLANLGRDYTGMETNAMQAAAKAKAEAALAGMGMAADASNSWLGALGKVGGGAFSWLASRNK